MSKIQPEDIFPPKSSPEQGDQVLRDSGWNDEQIANGIRRSYKLHDFEVRDPISRLDPAVKVGSRVLELKTGAVTEVVSIHRDFIIAEIEVASDDDIVDKDDIASSLPAYSEDDVQKRVVSHMRDQPVEKFLKKKTLQLRVGDYILIDPPDIIHDVCIYRKQSAWSNRKPTEDIRDIYRGSIVKVNGVEYYCYDNEDGVLSLESTDGCHIMIRVTSDDIRWAPPHIWYSL